MLLTTVILLGGSAVLGALLAWRFTVFVLIPAVALDLAVVTLVGVARGDDVWSVVLAMFLSAIGLQLGFLAGSAILHAIASARTSDGERKRVGSPSRLLTNFFVSPDKI